jgi:hypothetical protein
MILNHNSVPDYYGEKFKESLTSDDVQKLLLYNTTYTLFKEDSKIHSGYIRVFQDRIKSDELLTYNLRRILYASLGFFIDNPKVSGESILGKIPREEATLTDHDKKLLQVHYDHLTDLDVTNWDLYELYKARK